VGACRRHALFAPAARTHIASPGAPAFHALPGAPRTHELPSPASSENFYLQFFLNQIGQSFVSVPSDWYARSSTMPWPRAS